MNNNFMDAINNVLVNSNSNISITENGAIGYKTTGKKILDLNFQIPALRGMSDEEVITRFTEAYLQEPVVAFLWLFFARDAREGLGERRLFRTCLKFLHKKIKNMEAFVRLIPEYGRYDDLFVLSELGHKTEVMNFIKEQLAKDIVAEQSGKPVSLLAKWLKSVNTSSKESRKIALDTCKELGLTPEKYRKLLSRLRKYIDVTEVKMSANQFDKIDYSAVPSKAALNYKEAFKRHDGERYEEFINKVNKGEAKINASVLYPHEIVHRYQDGNSYWRFGLKRTEDASLEALWKNLPDLVKGNGGTMVVADGSGSMCNMVPGGKVTAWEVAHSLALYFAQRAKGAFKDKYITFSERPQLVQVGSGSLWQDLQIAMRHNECANTNIEAVFDLILKTAMMNHMSQDELPENILIISDMEFDSCAVDNSYSAWGSRIGIQNKNLFKVIEGRFKAAGYKLPRLVFWNVNSRTGTIPVKENELGVSLVSGFSVNIVKMVMDGELDPYINLLKVLFSERYQPIIDYLTENGI